MHEGSLCREIIDIVSKSASMNDIRHVYEIILRVGPYSCVHASQLNFYFDMMKKGTCMENAFISIERDDSIQGTSQMYVKTYRGE